MPSHRSASKISALVHAWLLLDFFGDARRSGASASTLTTTIFSQSFLALAIAALLFPEPPPVPFATANLCLSTLLVALGALDVEQPLNRRRADRVLLGTAPVGGWSIALARALHGAFHTVLLTVGMALPPGILLACRQHRSWLVPAYLLVACACTGLATGTLAVALAFARRWLGSLRTALIAGTGKALLLGGGVVLFALGLPALRRDADALPIGRLGAELLPPYHAAKLLAMPGTEAWRLLPLLALAALLLAAAAWLGDSERERREHAPRAGWLLRLDRAAAGSAPSAGLAVFTSIMLWRSPGLRARVLPLLGMPAAIAFLALRGEAGRGQALFLAMALQFPAIYLPFVIAFLPRADQPGTGWVFASAPPLPRPCIERAVWVALGTHVLLPVHLLALAVLLLSGQEVPAALTAVAFALGTGVLAACAMVRELDAIPFSRDRDADAGIELGNLLAYGLVLAGAGAGFALAPPAARFFLAALALAAAIFALFRRPR